jgi:hypothetical protein
MRSPLAALVAVALAAPGWAATRAVATSDLDVCVYGGTAAGIMAGVQVARLGGRVVVVEPTGHLGGLTTGGLGATDTGNAAVIGGLAREFYAAVREHYVSTYGEDSAQVRDCQEGFHFEPHVARDILRGFLERERVPVLVGEKLVRARTRDGRIVALVLDSGRVVRARVFIDCTYEGDLMAAAGVSYTVGREPEAQYGERYNGVRVLDKHQFTVPVPPYRYRNLPGSGLLWGFTTGGPGEEGAGDRCVQAYNLRMCLTSDPANRLPFVCPPGYDRRQYLLLSRWLYMRGPGQAPYHNVMMPNGKTDTNNNGPFSTDYIGASYGWPDADYATRERIYREHLHYQQGLMYFLTHDASVPLAVRAEAARWGPAADEFVDTGGWSPQLYVREGRRMVSDQVMTEHHCLGQEKVDDPVGMGAYGMDSHNCQRFIREGRALNEGDVQIRLPGPYPISYRSIRPRREECENLLVPVALSASHIAFGSIRMEPVFMVLGQSAAIAAWQSIETDAAVQDIDVAELIGRLRAAGQVLEYNAPTPTTEAALIDPASLPGLVIDDRDAAKEGTWTPSTQPEYRLVGTGYVHDGNADKGQARATYRFASVPAGTYGVVVIFPPHANRATNVPVTVRTPDGQVVAATVDERATGDGGFARILTISLPSTGEVIVTLDNTGTDGYVVTDGVQLLPIEAP